MMSRFQIVAMAGGLAVAAVAADGIPGVAHAQPAPVAEAAPEPPPAPAEPAASEPANDNAPAPEAAAQPASEDVGGLATELVRAVRDGDWRLAAALLISLLLMGARKLKVKEWKIFQGDRGGAAGILLLSLLGSIGTTLASDVALDFRTILRAIEVGFTAAGGFVIVKRLIWPKDDDDEKDEARVPTAVVK